VQKSSFSGVSKAFGWAACAALLGHASLASAHDSACTTDLLHHVFARHRSEPTPDTRAAIHSWLCEGASDNFLSTQPVLPTSVTDFPNWNALFAAINQNTVVGSTVSNGRAGEVATFRGRNCTSPSQRFMIHRLGRVADAANFSAFQACDAGATADANAVLDYYELDLACSAHELADGSVELSVGGFDSSGFSSAVPPLSNLQFVLSNATAAQNYTGETIASDGVGTFKFRVANPAQNASIGVGGSFQAAGLSTFHYCDIDRRPNPAVSTPYVIPHEVDCAFEANKPGPTSCNGRDDMKIEQTCTDGKWVSTGRCIPLCTIGATRRTATKCGIADEGRQLEQCTAEGWKPSLRCDSPNAWRKYGWQVEFSRVMTSTETFVPPADPNDFMGGYFWWAFTPNLSYTQNGRSVNVVVTASQVCPFDIFAHTITGDYGQSVTYKSDLDETTGKRYLVFWSSNNFYDCFSLKFQTNSTAEIPAWDTTFGSMVLKIGKSIVGHDT
jgi:hypothetical protein